MSTLTKEPLARTVAPRPVAEAPRVQCELIHEYLILDGISWSTYESFVNDFADRAGPRFTFDNGRLQIMSPQSPHEAFAYLIGEFIALAARRSGQHCRCFRTVTIKKKSVQRGLEPDNCFYLASWEKIKGKRTLDFNVDAPPDLAVEIDLTTDSLPRLPVYAALGVPEVWRFDGENLACHVLRDDGQYTMAKASRSFPWLSVADVLPLLEDVFDVDDAELKDRFETWIRSRIAPSAP